MLSLNVYQFSKLKLPLILKLHSRQYNLQQEKNIKRSAMYAKPAMARTAPLEFLVWEALAQVNPSGAIQRL
jgi:hypothetical protein